MSKRCGNLLGLVVLLVLVSSFAAKTSAQLSPQPGQYGANYPTVGTSLIAPHSATTPFPPGEPQPVAFTSGSLTAEPFAPAAESRPGLSDPGVARSPLRPNLARLPHIAAGPGRPVTPVSQQGQGPPVEADQPGSLQRAEERPQPGGEAVSPDQGAPVEPDQPGALERFEERISALEKGKVTYPIIRLSGFFHFDTGMFTQDAQSAAVLGDVQNGSGFRRARLQGLGNLTEFTGYSIEMDFGFPGRPSFMDVWLEQRELPLLGTVRIGQFRQPVTMDSWTNIKHMEFLERSTPFQAFDPFRRVGVMAYTTSEDERTMWAYSVFGTGWTFWNGTSTVYNTLGGDNRFGTQLTDRGGVAFALRGTHLLYYDDLAEGRYLLHVGGGYLFGEIGGEGTTGPDAPTYEARTIPEFFVGDPAGAGLTAAGTPFVVDTGRFLANNYNLFHLELAGNVGSAHWQTEYLASLVNQFGGPQVFYDGAYFQCGYFLTGESCSYNKQAGVLDYNVKPYTEFFGLGRSGMRMGGWGAWEVAFRWSYLNLNASINPANALPGPAGPPPSPNPGVLNESTVALNWWWNQYTRAQFNWIHSMAAYAAGNTGIMDIFAMRFQIEF